MSVSARAGALFYAKDLPTMASFYAHVLEATEVHSDGEHKILETPDVQLIIHAIPPT